MFKWLLSIIQNKPHYERCNECGEGKVLVRDYGSYGQFTETVTPCDYCGASVDECRWC